MAAGAVGCQNPLGRPSVQSDNPELMIPAVKRDVMTHDERDDPQLVRDLNDPDPAIRFYAIQGLRRLTGDDFGYRYYDDEPARAPAVSRWRAWLAGRGGGPVTTSG